MVKEVQEYIRGLSRQAEREQIDRYLARQMELGHRLVLPVSRPLRDGIHEIRPGPHRLLFFYKEGRIQIVHAFRKKTRETPDWEIKAALKRRELFLNG